MNHHDPAAVATWPPAMIVHYVAGLQAHLDALQPIVTAAIDWAVDPTDTAALLEALAVYRLPKREKL